MDDMTRARLGDQEAAKQLTDQGIILSCPVCGDIGYYQVISTSSSGVKRGFDFCIICRKCKHATKFYSFVSTLSTSGDILTIEDERKTALLEWNTRVPILTTEQIERLGG